MKYFLIILFICSFCQLFFGQTEKYSREKIEHIFIEINNSDATHIGEEIRVSIFENNFNQIVEIIKLQHYPSYSKEKINKKINKIIESVTRRTFLHILQTKPELLLNQETIELLKMEITQLRLDNEILKFVLSAFQYDQDQGNSSPWTDLVKENFYLAIREWDIKLYP